MKKTSLETAYMWVDTGINCYNHTTIRNDEVFTAWNSNGSYIIYTVYDN